MADIEQRAQSKMERLQEELAAATSQSAEMSLKTQSLLELNQSLKNNVLALHREKEELEDTLHDQHQKFMEFQNSGAAASSSTNTGDNDVVITLGPDTATATDSPSSDAVRHKVLDLQRKTRGFKDSVDGLRLDL